MSVVEEEKFVALGGKGITIAFECRGTSFGNGGLISVCMPRPGSPAQITHSIKRVSSAQPASGRVSWAPRTTITASSGNLANQPPTPKPASTIRVPRSSVASSA
jgi:putative transposon-encoded protein